MKKATLYYDGRCSMCSKEIHLLKKFKNSKLELVDIWQVEIDIPRFKLLRILHMRTSDGTWLTGLDANVAAWKHTQFGFLFSFLRWPLIKPIVDNVYHYWVKKRWAKKRLFS